MSRVLADKDVGLSVHGAVGRLSAARSVARRAATEWLESNGMRAACVRNGSHDRPSAAPGVARGAAPDRASFAATGSSGRLHGRRDAALEQGSGAAEQGDEADEAFGGTVPRTEVPPHARAGSGTRAPLRSLSAVFGGRGRDPAQRNELRMTEDTSSAGKRESRWGAFRWAAWLPESMNAVVVLAAMVPAFAGLIRPYSDEAIRRSLVDTYNVSAFSLMGVSTMGVVGIVCSVAVAYVTSSRRRRQLAMLQVLVLLVCVGVAAWAHHRLMERTTVLTGQTFEGCP